MIDINIILVALLLLTNAMVFASYMPFMSQKRRQEIVYDIAYSLVWEAERLYGAKSGLIKHAYVKAKMYVILSAMPTFRNSIIDGAKLEVTIGKAIQAVQAYMQEKNTSIL